MRKLGFIGGGNMAEALARGLIARRLFKPAEIVVSDVEAARRRRLGRLLKVAVTDRNAEAVQESRAVVLAVKPQQMDEVLAEIAGTTAGFAKRRAAGARAGRLFISIAAGITLARLRERLGPEARVIRVMPNAPAMVGRGMAAMVRSAAATKADEAFALRIFRAVGDAVALADESMLDAVTALSGSGPAYVYLFIQALAGAAAGEGLPRELALRMAIQTIEGAGHSLRASRLSAGEMIKAVASPGGTTEAALKQFAAAGFSDIVAAAVHAAAERSRELGRNY